MKIYRCKLSKPTQRRLAALFCAGASARAAAPLCGVARATATLFFRKIRAALAADKNATKILGAIYTCAVCVIHAFIICALADRLIAKARQ